MTKRSEKYRLNFHSNKTKKRLFGKALHGLNLKRLYSVKSNKNVLNAYLRDRITSTNTKFINIEYWKICMSKFQINEIYKFVYSTLTSLSYEGSSEINVVPEVFHFLQFLLKCMHWNVGCVGIYPYQRHCWTGHHLRDCVKVYSITIIKFWFVDGFFFQSSLRLSCPVIHLKAFKLCLVTIRKKKLIQRATCLENMQIKELWVSVFLRKVFNFHCNICERFCL